MPARRSVLRGIGSVLLGSVAGCATSKTTTGVVAQKKVRVSVPRTVGGPVVASLAVLSFESDGVVTGQYADIVSETVDDASMSVSDSVHNRLANRFPDIRYHANIVPAGDSTPASGLVSRAGFNTLTVGGTATVDAKMKTVDEEASVGYLEIQDTQPRETPASETRISQYDWEERADEIQDK